MEVRRVFKKNKFLTKCLQHFKRQFLPITSMVEDMIEEAEKKEAEKLQKIQNSDIIYFSVNNWFSGRDYPDTPNFRKWLGDDLNQTFRNDEWCKENHLCVYYGCIDMSSNYTVSAPREWVEKNCPELLTNDEYSYVICSYYKGKETRETIKNKFSNFVYVPEEGDDMPYSDRFDMPFREYKEENFGCEYYETGYWDESSDEEDEEND